MKVWKVLSCLLFTIPHLYLSIYMLRSHLLYTGIREIEITLQKKGRAEFFTPTKEQHTSFLRFICQCWSCSWGLRQLLLLSVSGKHPSTSIGSVILSSSVALFSWIEGKVLQSRGLHSPKSESFMCPSLSKRRLSGLISLQKVKRQEINQNVHKYQDYNHKHAS